MRVHRVENLPAMEEETLSGDLVELEQFFFFFFCNGLFVVLKLVHFDRTRLGMSFSQVTPGNAWGCSPHGMDGSIRAA